MDSGNDVTQRLAALEDEVRALRAQLGPRAEAAIGEPTASWSRRSLLLGGAAAALGGAAGLAGAAPASAAVGAMQYGATNNSGTDQTKLTSTHFSSTLSVANTSPGAGSGQPAHAIFAQSVSASGAAVSALGLGATAVLAQSNGARGLVAGAIYGRGGDNCGVVAISDTGAPLRVGNTSLSAVPDSGSWTQGDFVSVNGALWFCVASGSPGQWRLLASGASAGAFVPITPARVYDSRYTSALDSGVGPLASGGSRLISAANSYTPGTNTLAIANVVPAGARAVALNLTIVSPTGPGYMFIAPGTTASITGSSINWTAANATIANGLTVGLDGFRRLKAFLAVSGGGSSHFIVDVNGYFLGH